MLTILFDGIAYGMVLFVLACGLAVTLGLMNFINLAHGAFAMAAATLRPSLMNRYGVPFLVTLPLAFSVPALVGLVLERRSTGTLYAAAISIRFCSRSASSSWRSRRSITPWARSSNSIQLPTWLQGRVDMLGVQVGLYRSFIIVVCGVLVVALQLILTRTRFGSRLRAAVDDPRVAGGSASMSALIFAMTFAVGSGLAGLGGALGAEILGLDPTFPLKFMIYFLIVVTVGGTTSITGPFLASLMLGIADVAGKYYVPSLGAFVIYTLMIVVLVLRPQGLFARAR